MVPIFSFPLFLHFSFLSLFNYVNPHTHKLLGLVPQILDLVFPCSSHVSCALQKSSAMILMLDVIMSRVNRQVKNVIIIRVGL